MNDPDRPTGQFPEEFPAESPPVRPPARVQEPANRPLVTFALLGVSIAIFSLQMLSTSIYGFDLIADLGVKENSLIAQGQYWRLFTPMLLHGSILHLAFNMYALYIFGPGLERYYGHARYLALYLISGFAGNVFSLIFTSNPSLGASTAIFGLIGAEVVFLYQNRGIFGSGARRALNQLIFIAVINIAIGFSPQIDNWGHIGGLVGGALFAWFAGPVLKVKGEYPALVVADGREIRMVVVTGISVSLFFALLAAASIYLF